MLRSGKTTEAHRATGKAIFDACYAGKTPWTMVVCIPGGMFKVKITKLRKPKKATFGVHYAPKADPKWVAKFSVWDESGPVVGGAGGAAWQDMSKS